MPDGRRGPGGDDPVRRHLAGARHLRAIGRTEGALEECSAALALNPDSVDAHVLRARLLLDLHEPAAALEAADTVLRLSPDQSRGWLYRSWSLYELQSDQGAMLESAERAIQLDPGDATAAFHRVRAYLVTGDRAQAIRCAEALRDADPDSFWTHLSYVIVEGALARQPERRTSIGMIVLVVVLTLITGGVFLIVFASIWTFRRIRAYVHTRRADRHVQEAIRQEPTNAALLALRADLSRLQLRPVREIDYLVRSASEDIDRVDMQGLVTKIVTRVVVAACVLAVAWIILATGLMDLAAGDRLSIGLATAVSLGSAAAGAAGVVLWRRLLRGPLTPGLRAELDRRRAPVVCGTLIVVIYLVLCIGQASDETTDLYATAHAHPLGYFATWLGAAAAVAIPTAVGANRARPLIRR